jgi:hypothetical protein
VADYPTYRDLVELARICVRQARAMQNPDAIAELHRLADDYRHKAAALDGGALPDIGLR